MIRLLVSDIDGTLVTNDKELTAEAHHAADVLTQHGIKLVLVSSRPPRGVAVFADALKLSTPHAAFNGGVFSAPDGSVLHAQLLEPEAASAALAYLIQRGISPWLFTADKWLLTDPNGDYVDWEQQTIKFPPEVVADFKAASDSAGKIMGASKDFAKLAACEAELRVQLKGHAAVHLSQEYYLDVTHPLANKGEAVRLAAGMLGIGLEETACIGDMANDLPMFDVAAYRIAMGNATQAIRGRADYVTGSNQENGWAQAVERFVLLHARGD